MPTKATKARSRLLCCFTGSPVSDSGELDLSVCGTPPPSGGKARSVFSLHRFRAKKKTVPIFDAIAEVLAGADGERVDEEKMMKKVSHHKLTKEISSNESQKHTKGSKSKNKTICQVFSKCAAPNQPALICQVAAPVQIQTGPSYAISDTEQNPPTNASKKSQKKTKKRYDEVQQVVGLLVLVVALATMLGGRSLAVICTSALFYLLPLVKPSPMTRKAVMSPRGQRSSMVIDMSSEEYKKKVVLQGLLERNGRRTT